ncbi:unnamed protein product [Ixodes pacificus]
MTRSLGRQRCKYVKYSENIYSRQAKCHFHKIKKINMVGFHNKGHIPRVQFAPLVKKNAQTSIIFLKTNTTSKGIPDPISYRKPLITKILPHSSVQSPQSIRDTETLIYPSYLFLMSRAQSCGTLTKNNHH